MVEEIKDLTIVKNDKYKIYFYLKEEDPITGNVNSLDLTGVSSINFRLKNVSTGSLLLSGTCQVENATQGICSYYLEGADTVGEYKGEVECVFADKVITFTGIRVYIVEELG